MSKALKTLREKLEYLQQQEAVLSDPAQKFTVAKQIEETKEMIAGVEAMPAKQGWRGKRTIVVVVSVAAVIVAGCFYFFGRGQKPGEQKVEVKQVTAALGFSVFEKAEHDARIISRVKPGEVFELIPGNDGSHNWTRVRHQEKDGWALAQDMSVVTPIDIAQGFGFRGPYWRIFFTAPQPTEGKPNEYGIDARFAEAVTQCKKTLDIALYELNCRIVTDAILEAHSRNVKVRVVTDAESLNASGTTLGELVRNGIPVAAKQPGPERQMHSRFAIMDGTTVWTGSWNYADGATFKSNENVIAIEAPEVAQLFVEKFRTLFAADPEAPPPARSGPSSARTPLPHGIQVFFAPEDPTREALMGAFREARHSIRFMTYSFSVEDVFNILKQQAAKGVSVRGIAERSRTRTDAAKAILTARIPNLEVRKDLNHRDLRHNCVIIDDRMVWLGSMNIGKSGNIRNDENLMAIPDAALAAKCIEEFDRLWSVAKADFDAGKDAEEEDEDGATEEKTP